MYLLPVSVLIHFFHYHIRNFPSVRNLYALLTHSTHTNPHSASLLHISTELDPSQASIFRVSIDKNFGNNGILLSREIWCRSTHYMCYLGYFLWFCFSTSEIKVTGPNRHPPSETFGSMSSDDLVNMFFIHVRV